MTALERFRAARARPAPLDALADLIGAEPTLERAVDAIVELAQRDVAPLVSHDHDRTQVTTVARADAPTWVARMWLGQVTRPSPSHPQLDCAPLLGAGFPAERAKLRCMLAYFERLAAGETMHGTLRFERIVIRPRGAADWLADTSPLLPIDVRHHGAIEDAHGHRQIDFANKFLGGGVLSGGNVQEEIRFAVAPEHLVAMIVSPVMLAHEAIAMHGCETFAATRGYGGTLAYAGALRDPAPRLADGTPDVELVAIDAVDYRRGDRSQQYLEPATLRELTKAVAGFRRDAANAPIATGNWGCGAFQGDPPHKAILQWLAASAEGRTMRYYTFDDPRVGELEAFAATAIAKLGTVGALYDRLQAIAASNALGAVIYDIVLGR